MLQLNLLTANIHMGFTAGRRRFVLPELRQAIRAVAADIVFLQEVMGAHSGHAGRQPRWPEVPHYEFLADQLWPQFAYGRNAAYPEGHHGNALLSKFPIVSEVNRDVSITGAEGRGLLHCVLQVPGTATAVHAICTHLGLREGHRRRQLGLLCEVLESEVPAGAPLLVAGDFNDWRARGHALLERCGLREAHLETRGRLARTFPVRWPLLPLDRIYVRNVQVHEAVVLAKPPWAHLSDHATLAASVGVATDPRSGAEPGP
ncbi:endonuclease/exonuclease/phosphatase family protein [Luteimonas sp. RD2P54]|uniref:Endonuclease/exonuclease/phosphatase family protein n=1 Tax=Luteimonas endophytica TaxID=3042023 RepID=A0ABT6JC24_9GAMM|nr:endonuclease/exonuclease/phosphatase family protein [Luteimonas endophytica]MDH5824346.1 endonuclease/exonuclease/phosphatase family protein [Luteimonas endophytica]